MHFSVLLALVFIALQNPVPAPTKVSEPQQNQPTARQQPANTDQRGTEQSPLVVQTLEPPKSQAEIKQEGEDRNQKATNDGRIVILTGVLALVAIGQLGVYLYQAIKLRETVKTAGEQSAAMDRHISEAARSATAMENIATKIEAGNQEVMRAYLTVVVGGAVFQQREKERQTKGDVKFEGKPHIVNTGNTPARNILIRIGAAILPLPIPDDFTYPLPGEPIKSAGVVGPRQNYILSAIVKDFVPDAEVGDIKHGNGRVLCVWGVVTYDDMFGCNHTTKFGQWLSWLPDNNVYGVYIPGQNDAD